MRNLVKSLVILTVLLACLVPLASLAQSPVAITAQVTGTNSAPYAYGSYQIQLVDSSGNAIVSGTIYGVNYSATQYTGFLSSTGTLAVSLIPNSYFTSPVGTTATYWKFSVCSYYNATGYSSTIAAYVDGAQTCYSSTVTVAAAGNYSAQISSGAPAIYAQNLTTGVSYFSNVSNFPSVSLQEEFCGNAPGTSGRIGDMSWDSTVIVGGTNPVAAVASVANHPCLITLTTSTTATNGVSITLGPAVGVLFPGSSINWSSQSVQAINQIATGSYRIGFGTVDTATAIPTNGIYFRFMNGTDTYINACSDSAGTETCTATTVAPTAGDYVDLLMSSTTAGNVAFTVRDITTPASSTVTLCPAGCTAAATLPTVVLSPMFNIVETGGSVADVLTVDYFGYQQSVTR
jgi:hypothetical protein